MSSGVRRLKVDRGLWFLPRMNGSTGGILVEGVSIEVSMFTGVVCEIVVLVLEVLGVEGVGGCTIDVVDGCVVVVCWCGTSLNEIFGLICIG
jgi:type IV secretory pathway TrbD component